MPPTSSSVFAAFLVLVSLSVSHIVDGTTSSGLPQKQLSNLPHSFDSGLSAATESQSWKRWRSAEEAPGHLAELLRQFESRFEGEPEQIEPIADQEKEERHPGEKLLQSHGADATESYILGGY